MNSELIQSISQSDPVVKFCELFDGLSPLWNYELHNHPYLELVYMKSGCGQTDLLEDKQVCTSFDTRVYPVGCWHQDKFEASASNIACMKRPADTGGFPEQWDGKSLLPPVYHQKAEPFS